MRALKRILDVLVASITLALFSPILVIVYISVFLGMGGPVIFRQVRPGYKGQPMIVFKVRTMKNTTDPDGKPLPDSMRLTPLGRFLRKTSLDELPQLWNVVRGDLSLVGPRPLLDRYMPHYTPKELQRFEVRPGITGWAQIHGRNQSSWDDRLSRDVWYVENWSFWLDLKILALTVVTVLTSRGVVSDPGSTMLDLDVERANRGLGQSK